MMKHKKLKITLLMSSVIVMVIFLAASIYAIILSTPISKEKMLDYHKEESQRITQQYSERIDMESIEIYAEKSEYRYETQHKFIIDAERYLLLEYSGPYVRETSKSRGFVYLTYVQPYREIDVIIDNQVYGYSVNLSNLF